MIVKLRENSDLNFQIEPNDVFKMTTRLTNDLTGERIVDNVITERFTEKQRIRYAISFVFCDKDGTVSHKNICGCFCEKVPEELERAPFARDLLGIDLDMHLNFVESIGMAV